MTYTLHLGNCLDILPTLEAGSVDAVITDPPYGIANIWKGGNSHGWGVASLATPKRNQWDERPLNKSEIAIILSCAETIVIWGGNFFELPPSRGWLVWNKPERGFSLAEAELAWTSVDFPVRVFDYRRSDPGREHPTQKPVALMKWCIELVTQRGATILDPFMGSGTTGVACMQTGRNFIGIELDPGYYAIAEKRIAQAAAQPLLFQDAPKREQAVQEAFA